MSLHGLETDRARAASADAGELIPADAPTRARGLAVLDGVLSGFVWVDDPVAPRELLVIEDADGTVFAGGPPSRGDVMDALTGLATQVGRPDLRLRPTR